MSDSQASTPRQFVPASQLLPTELLESLSAGSLRLYATIWNRMAELGVTELATVNSAIASRSKIAIDQLIVCQRQLASAGLLGIELDSRPGFAEQAKRTVYKFPEEESLA